jgi:hypothetical protein
MHEVLVLAWQLEEKIIWLPIGETHPITACKAAKLPSSNKPSQSRISCLAQK